METVVPKGGSTTCNEGTLKAKKEAQKQQAKLIGSLQCSSSYSANQRDVLAKRTACSHYVIQMTSAVDVCLGKVTSQHPLPFSTLALCIHEGCLNARISQALAALSSTYTLWTRICEIRKAMEQTNHIIETLIIKHI